MNWKPVLFLLAFIFGPVSLIKLALSISDKANQKPYVFKLIRPDGTTHKEYEGTAVNPIVVSSRRHGGQFVLNVDLPTAPIGWLWEIEQVKRESK